MNSRAVRAIALSLIRPAFLLMAVCGGTLAAQPPGLVGKAPPDAIRTPMLLRVDASLTRKLVTPLNGVNAGPGHLPGGMPGDLTSQYQEMGIPLVRMHDFYGPGDLSEIFGTDLDADPGDLLNYHFTHTDAVVEEIGGAGCRAMFRFGQSWNNCQQLNYVPPERYDTLAQVCSTIAGHYGGAGSEIVRLWEIWNEADLQGHPFWNHSADPDPQDFYGLYSAVAKRLKLDHPGIVVGGPGAAGGSDETVLAVAESFLSACRKHEAPLDFYSWHSYNRNQEGPYCYTRQAKLHRDLLDSYAFRGTKLILGEWNSANARVRDREWKASLHNIHGAAFTAAVLVYLHQSGAEVSETCRYRGDIHSGNWGYGLVRDDFQIKTPGYAFRAYSCLFPADKEKIFMLGSSGGNLGGRALMATTDYTRQAVHVLVSFWKCDGATRLRIDHLPADWQRCSVWHCRVTTASDWEPLAFQTVMAEGGSVGLDIPDSPGESSVHILRISGEPIPQLALPPVGKPFRKPSVTVQPRKPPIIERPGRTPKPKPPKAGSRGRQKTQNDRPQAAPGRPPARSKGRNRSPEGAAAASLSILVR